MRVSLRLDDTHERLKYWSARKQVSLNTYILDAIDLMIAHENRDYDVPTALMQRINRIIGTVMAVQSSMDNLTNVTINVRCHCQTRKRRQSLGTRRRLVNWIREW